MQAKKDWIMIFFFTEKLVFLDLFFWLCCEVDVHGFGVIKLKLCTQLLLGMLSRAPKNPCIQTHKMATSMHALLLQVLGHLEGQTQNLLYKVDFHPHPFWLRVIMTTIMIIKRTENEVHLQERSKWTSIVSLDMWIGNSPTIWIFEKSKAD